MSAILIGKDADHVVDGAGAIDVGNVIRTPKKVTSVLSGLVK